MAQEAASISITNAGSFDATPEGARAMFEEEGSRRMRWYERVAAGISDKSLQQGFFDEDGQ